MEVENQEGQGPLWAVVPLMMMSVLLKSVCVIIDFNRKIINYITV
jgi:hypothetical protein